MNENVKKYYSILFYFCCTFIISDVCAISKLLYRSETMHSIFRAFEIRKDF